MGPIGTFINRTLGTIDQAVLHFMTLVLALGSLAIYGYVALGPPRAKPAFFFLVIPPASLTLIAVVAAMRTKNGKA